jgi:hypothetical protein
MFISLFLFAINILCVFLNMYFIVNDPYPSTFFNIIVLPFNIYTAYLMLKQVIGFTRSK